MALKLLHSRAVAGRMWQMLTQPGQPTWIDSLAGSVIDGVVGEETYVGVGTVPGFRVWEGGRKSVQLLAKGFTIANETYEWTLRIQGKDIRRAAAGQRGVVGQIDKRIAMGRVRYDQLWAKLLSPLIINGESNVGYDGIAYHSAAHTENGQPNQTNIFSIAKAGALPTAAEAEASLVGAIAQTKRLKDDSGEPVDPANSWVVMIPPEMEPAFSVALKAPVVVDAGLAGVRTNVLSVYGGARFTLVTNPRLIATTEYYLFADDGTALIMQSELPLKISSKAENSEFEHDYDAHEHGALTIRGAGYGNWQSSVKVKFTGP